MLVHAVPVYARNFLSGFGPFPNGVHLNVDNLESSVPENDTLFEEEGWMHRRVTEPVRWPVLRIYPNWSAPQAHEL